LGPNSASLPQPHAQHIINLVTEISNTVAPQPVSYNQHPMQTHGKCGISKHKNIFSLTVKHVDPNPTSFSQVFKSSTWHHAMVEELNVFLENDT